MERISIDMLARELEADGATLKYFKTDVIGFSIAPEKWNERKYTKRTYEFVDPFDDSELHT
eukprot:2661121-Pleurochrysis_carterae.AAC.1